MSNLQEKIDALSAALADVIKETVLATVKVGGGTKAAAAEEPAAAPAKRTRRAKPAEPEVSLEDVRTAMIALADAKDKAAVVEVLSRFGVAKIGDLKPENYAECKELAEAETADGGDAGDEDPFAE